MSKLWDALNASATGRRVLGVHRTSVSMDEMRLPGLSPCQTQYALETKISTVFAVDEHAHPAVFDAAVRRARRVILEEVFGEFRGPLVEAIDALNRHDVPEAMLIIEAVLDSMFSDGAQS